jgi:hypothetical protein
VTFERNKEADGRSTPTSRRAVKAGVSMKILKAVESACAMSVRVGVVICENLNLGQDTRAGGVL